MEKEILDKFKLWGNDIWCSVYTYGELINYYEKYKIIELKDYYSIMSGNENYKALSERTCAVATIIKAETKTLFSVELTKYHYTYEWLDDPINHYKKEYINNCITKFAKNLENYTHLVIQSIY